MDVEQRNHTENPTTLDHKNEKILKMMEKMGYTAGKGLGKSEGGALEPLDCIGNLGKRGLGCVIPGLEASTESWDFSLEEIHVCEELNWISCATEDNGKNCFTEEQFRQWKSSGPRLQNIDNETLFCSAELLGNIIKAKNVLDELDEMELCKARSRANSFETIKSAIFMNRAALKMANIDAAADFMFTNIDRNPHHHKKKGAYYFADVCAGPGGFSEYVLWRKEWLMKGFGITLLADRDFELADSCCASDVTFSSQYGAYGDGDVCRPENISHFASRVVHECENLGVHFMMSDGGFSVEGNEILQEVLSKQLYTCQCLMALKIVRPWGHFVTKVFDLFTLYSVGLVYLMYQCFERIAILKPNSSRPANSERYLVCEGLRRCQQTNVIQQYLQEVVKELWASKQADPNGHYEIDQLVPLDVIKKNETFYNYIINSNERIGKAQYVGLLKLAAFCRNPALVEPRQEELRKKSLEVWQIPDRLKIPLPRLTTDDLLEAAVQNPDFMLVNPLEIRDLAEFRLLSLDMREWYFTHLSCKRRPNICNIYVGVGNSKVYRLQRCKWVQIKHVKLAQGTLLYGEMVKERIVQKVPGTFDYKEEVQRQSLHVIDALRLGNTSLADLPFTERLDLIAIYCEAVNHESRPKQIRVRVKPTIPLEAIASVKLFPAPKPIANYFSILPKLGYDSLDEYYPVNSLLLLKVDAEQSFVSTYACRIQVIIEDEPTEPNHVSNISLNSITELVKTSQS